MTVDAVAPDNFQSSGTKPSRGEILASFKERDNVTNFFHIGKIYAILLTTLFLVVYTGEMQRAGEFATGWFLLVAVIAILVIGASQHQFGAIIHEGTHYTLFKNRKLNELVSDWLGGFPIYTSTQSYRLHHFAHHQFVNDPERDPIATQAAESNHWLDFPVTHFELVKGFGRLVWPLNLLKYMVSRAKHSTLPHSSNPFSQADSDGNPWAIHVGILFAVGLPILLSVLVAFKLFEIALGILVVAWIASTIFYLTLKDEDFPQTQIKTVISDKYTTLGRTGYMGTIYAALTLIEFNTGAPAWGYFGIFWILPLFTAFPIFMVLREWVQHGNADRGRLTNSRVFLVDPFSRYAVFPLGMDYHLPHHLYASVPHYRLKALHEYLLSEPDYSENARTVRGWTGISDEGDPSIVEVLGPEYAVRGEEIYVAEETLDEAELVDAERLKQESEASRKGKIW